ncbi:MAG: EamA family transporter [Saprospiraceae bacterium]|nr:EamA family transporter [Saprospiraceae bacterium]
MTNDGNMTRAYLALAAICIIWGTTYTAIKYAVRDFPPFLLVGIRQTAAGLLLLGIAWVSGRFVWPNPQYAFRQTITGLATITGGNGFITWGMQYVSSGLAALIGSLTPVMVVLISLTWQGSERINTRVVLGVLLGFGGLALIFSEGWQDFMKPEYRWGIAGCFASCFTWSLGTVMAKQWNAPQMSPLLNAGLQIFAGGVGGLALSALFDSSHAIHHTVESWLSMLYLVVIGSALAFTFYMYALKHLSATVSSLYTYINPVVAILLGWLWLGEALTVEIAVGMVVTIAGVWLVNVGARR